jgi:hypothetical protein
MAVVFHRQDRSYLKLLEVAIHHNGRAAGQLYEMRQGAGVIDVGVGDQQKLDVARIKAQLVNRVLKRLSGVRDASIEQNVPGRPSAGGTACCPASTLPMSESGGGSGSCAAAAPARTICRRTRINRIGATGCPRCRRSSCFATRR